MIPVKIKSSSKILAFMVRHIFQWTLDAEFLGNLVSLSRPFFAIVIYFFLGANFCFIPKWTCNASSKKYVQCCFLSNHVTS